MIPLRVVCHTIEALRALHIWRYIQSTIRRIISTLYICGHYNRFLAFAYNAILQLSRLVVEDLHTVRHLAGKFYKVLMCWVLVDIIVAIFLAFEFYNKSVGEVTLVSVSN